MNIITKNSVEANMSNLAQKEAARKAVQKQEGTDKVQNEMPQFAVFPAHTYDDNHNEIEAKGIYNTTNSYLSTMDRMVGYIKENARLREHTLKARELYKPYKDSGYESKELKKPYDQYKKLHFDLVSFAGVLKDGHRSNDSVTDLTGYIGIDIDGKDNRSKSVGDMTDAAREVFGGSILLMYNTISGDGIHIIVHHGITDKNRHLDIFDHCEELMKQRGIQIDTACKDPSRGFFLNWDAAPYYNSTPEVFPIPEKVETPKLEYTATESKAPTFNIDTQKTAEPDFSAMHSTEIFPGSDAEWEEYQYMIGKTIEKAKKGELDLNIYRDRTTWKRALFASYNSFGAKCLPLFEQFSMVAPGYDAEGNRREIDAWLNERINKPKPESEQLHWPTLRYELKQLGVPTLVSEGGEEPEEDEPKIKKSIYTDEFVEQLPPMLRYVAQVTKDPYYRSMLIGGALAAGASLMKNVYYIEPHDYSEQPINIFFSVVGEPSTGKGLLKKIKLLVQWHDAELREEGREAYSQWKIQYNSFESKKDRENWLVHNPQPTIKTFIVGGNLTSAGFEEEARKSGRLFLFDTEGDTLLESIDDKRYGTKLRAMLCKFFDGDNDNKTRGTENKDGETNANVNINGCICMGMQPSIYMNLINTKLGNAERFSFCCTIPTIRQRDEWNLPGEISKDVGTLIKKAAEDCQQRYYSLKARAYNDNVSKNLRVYFDDDDIQRMRQWRKESFALKGKAFDSIVMRGVQYIERIAGELTYYELETMEVAKCESIKVPLKNIEAAIKIVEESFEDFRYYYEMVRAVNDRKDDKMKELSASRRKLLSICPDGKFFKRDVAQRAKELGLDIDHGIKDLCNWGYLAKDGEGKGAPYYKVKR